jgi:hypothetical protein
LSVEEVARIVSNKGPLVCAVAVNGTRRWFTLEYPDCQHPEQTYLDAMTELQVKLCQMFFDHGVDTLVMPVFGPDLLDRGEDYTQMAMEGLMRLATHPQLTEFYKAQQVRVNFYGDYRAHLQHLPEAAELFAALDAVVAQTRSYSRRRLFYGVFAHDGTQTVAQLAIEFYQQHQRAPTQVELIERYYGEPLSAVNLFVGFDTFCAFDMPLLSTAETDLYFTVSPTPYLTPHGVRHILYDHLFARRAAPVDYSQMKPEAWQRMCAFYRGHGDVVAGVGSVDENGIWYSHYQSGMA